MLWSKYNFIFDINENKVGVYNSFTNAFVALSKEEYSGVEIKLNQNKLDELPEELLHTFIKNKNIVDSDDDVFNIIKFKSYQSRFSKEVLNITIAPTVDCNFSCFYCFEQHKHNSYMNIETEKNVINFIKSFNTKRVHILWFGGEPLLNFKSIKSLTNELVKNKFDLSASIITNGYLLTKEKVDLLNELRINSVQISLDGVNEMHNVRRTHKKGYQTFNKIVENLDYLVEYTQQNPIQIPIKVTVDNNNKTAFPEVFNYIKQKYPEQFENRIIDVSIAFVNNEANGENVSSCVFKNDDKINYYKYLRDIGFDKKRLKNLLEPRLNVSECMMRCVNSFGIGPDGYIYKCLEDFGNHSKTIGNINNKNFDNNLFAKLTIAKDVFDNNVCKDCSFLPICGGGCPYIRICTPESNDNFHCSIYKEYLSDILNMYYSLNETYV